MVSTALSPAGTTSAATSAGRHRKPRRRAAVAVACLGILGAATVGATAVAGDRGRGFGCGSSDPLEVRAAAEVAPAIETAATFLRCTPVVVTVASPAEVAQELAAGRATFDVWVPDSSTWLKQSTAESVSIAWSPVVLAVPAASRHLGAAATLEEVALAAAADDAVLSLPSPSTSATAQAAVATLAESLGSAPTQRGALAALLRAGITVPGARADARPTTEQLVWSANEAGNRPAQRAVYAASTGRAMDYPYVVTGLDPRTRRDAAALREVLTGAAGQAVLEGLGFRSVAMEKNPLLTREAGVDPTQAARLRALTLADSAAALDLLATLQKPSRVLALVDVSGSMDRPVPGTSLTRMRLAREAIREGLALFPRGTVAGLWRFSSDLTPSTNHEQVTPMTVLTPAARRTLAGAVGGLTAVPLGGTGLYDSVLAAVRYVRAGYDPAAVNSVVVLSDGRNEAASAHGIAKRTLLRALRAEADPERPVVVVAVAYGPDSDTAALRAISEATGGSLHVARDPRDLPMIFRAAIGSRVNALATSSRRGSQ